MGSLNVNPPAPKVFGIGLSKTGTTSLSTALEMLGYRTKDYPGLARYVPGDLGSIDPAVLDQHDALTDTPIPSFYRELDRRYPGSKFILTVRDMDGWLQSCKKQFSARHAAKQSDANNRLFVDLYGTAVFDEAQFRAGYRRFVEGVMLHFKDRPGDLLVLDISAGQGWAELCAFLGKPEPGLAFPKTNVTRIQWMDLRDLASIAQEAGAELLRIHQELSCSGNGGASGLGSIVRRTMYSIAGGRPAVVQAAASASQKILARRLGRLNPDLAIVSRLSGGVTAADRTQWSHFWLVDPLDGEAWLGTGGGEFTVNIALVEGRRPIAGVVHAPLSRTTYFAMAGKGAYRAVGDGEAIPLDAPANSSRAMLTRPDAPSAHVALGLCRSLETGEANAGMPVAGSMGWQTAAPHAIARVLGRRLTHAEGGTELGYDPVDLDNPPLRIT